jgi:hypothetical protein
MEFTQIWVLDTEYFAPPGEIPEPLCVCAHEVKSGQTIREWLLGQTIPAPIPNGPSILQAAYQAESEWSCYLPEGWPEPENILDLKAEFRCRTNGLEAVTGKGRTTLLGAASYFGIDAMTTAYKDSMHKRIVQGPPYSSGEQQDILQYCAEDVKVTVKLFAAMWKKIDWPRALIRGKYTWCVTCMGHTGVPIDMATLTLLRENWEGLQAGLIDEINPQYNIYENGTFRLENFERYLSAQGITWPRTPAGRLHTDDNTFKTMAGIHPELLPLKELRATLSALKLQGLTAGRDGRNRTKLWPYGAKTARNLSSSTESIFGPAVWMRSLITPAPGRALAYIDYEKEEWGIAAFFSRDARMQAAYAAEDPYIQFGILAGILPEGATKKTHGRERDLLKSCVLGVQYGMGAGTLALRIEKPSPYAKELLDYHKQVFRKYWVWSQAVADQVELTGHLQTCFGWNLFVENGVNFKNERSVRNFPMQAHGSEILRIACILLVGAGITICWPVHDALLIEAPATEIDLVTARAQTLMLRASRIVLKGFGLKTEATIIRPGERYSDPRGQAMWELVNVALQAGSQLRVISAIAISIYIEKTTL